MPGENNPTLLTCPTCNAPLDFDGVHNVVRCKFCGNTSVIPAPMVSDFSVPGSDWDDIRELVQSGHLDEAVEKFHTVFNANADESRRAVSAIADGKIVTNANASRLDSTQLYTGMEEVQHLAGKGEIVDAIKRYRELFNVDLASAKETVEQIANWSRSQAEGIPPSSLPVKRYKTRAIIIISILILVMGGVVALILSGALAPHYLTTQNDIFIPALGEQKQGIVSAFYDSMGQKRFIGLIDIASGNLRWKSEPVKEVISTLAAGSDLVYLANGSRLTAFRLADGTPAWQTEMSDQLAYGDTTLLVIPGRVVVLTTDRNIAAYDATSGKQAWSRQINSYDNTLRLMGGELVVVDYLPGTYDESLYFLNPVNGNEQAHLSPVCAANNTTYTIDNDTLMAYDQAENSLYLVFREGCLQRINLNDKKIVWSTIDQNPFTYLYEGYTYLLTSDSLYFGNDGDLVQVDKGSGKDKILLSNVDYELYPLAQSGNTLLMRAKRTRGTTQFELWGVDTQTGALSWQRNLQSAEPLDPPDEMVGLVDDTDWGWTWHLTDAGLVLLMFSGEPNQVTIETLNPKDGTSLGQQITHLKRVQGTFYSIPTVIMWQGYTVYLDIDINIYALDVPTGKLRLVY